MNLNMKKFICRAIIKNKKVSFPVYTDSFESALVAAYRYVVDRRHGQLLTVSEGVIVYA